MNSNQEIKQKDKEEDERHKVNNEIFKNTCIVLELRMFFANRVNKV